MSRTRAALMVLTMAALAGACGDDPTGPGDASLVIVDGDNQTADIGSQLPDPLTVRVENASGAPISGVSVSWALASAAGPGSRLGATSSTSAADGTASVDFTVGEEYGVYEVRASVSGSSVTFTANAAQPGTCGGIGAGLVDLDVGEDIVLGDRDLDCVELPAATGETEYEVVVTPLPQTLGFTDMEIAITGEGGVTRVVTPSSPVTLRADYQMLVGSGELPNWRATQSTWDRSLRELEQPLRPAMRAAAGRGSDFAVMSAPPQVGDITDFGFSCVAGDSRFPNAPDSISAEVIHISTTAVIYEDTLARGSFTPAEYAAIGANFDAYTAPAVEQYFGTPADLPSDPTPGQVIILYTSGVNQMTENYTQGFIAGFFCPQDAVGANNAKMFYLLVPDPNGDFTPGSDAGVLTKENALILTDNTAAHEYQHLVNFIEGSGAVAEVDVNEGLSHLSEEVVGHAAAQGEGFSNFVPGGEIGPNDILAAQQTVDLFNKWYLGNWQNLASYLQAPRDTAGLLNSSDPGAPGTFRMRGTNWMFIRYLLDRFGTPPTEWQLTQALITDGASNARDAITNVFGQPFEQLVAEWSAMLILEGSGVAVRNELLLPSWQMRALFDNPNIGPALNFPAPIVGWPLDPVDYPLSASAVDPADLFAGTSAYLTLGSAGAVPSTKLRLQMAGTGADVAQSIMPRMVITRTK